MSQLLRLPDSLVCPFPKLFFHHNRNYFDAKGSLESLWERLDDLGSKYCMYYCAACANRIDDNEEREFDPSSKLRGYFNEAHVILGQLPDNIFQHLLSFTNGDCPVCAVLTALKQFPLIARNSKTPPVDYVSSPCRSSNGFFFSPMCHIYALAALDDDSLPPRLMPAERHEIKTRLTPGKKVVVFIRTYSQISQFGTYTVIQARLCGIIDLMIRVVNFPP